MCSWLASRFRRSHVTTRRVLRPRQVAPQEPAESRGLRALGEQAQVAVARLASRARVDRQASQQLAASPAREDRREQADLLASAAQVELVELEELVETLVREAPPQRVGRVVLAEPAEPAELPPWFR